MSDMISWFFSAQTGRLSSWHDDTNIKTNPEMSLPGSGSDGFHSQASQDEGDLKGHDGLLLPDHEQDGALHLLLQHVHGHADPLRLWSKRRVKDGSTRAEPKVLLGPGGPTLFLEMVWLKA